MRKVDLLKENIEKLLPDQIISSNLERDELTIIVDADNIVEVMTKLRDDESTMFEQCQDLCGVDYSTYRNAEYEGPRFAVIYHLLSITHNWRIRIKAFAKNDNFPVIKSVVNIWSSVNWFEREAFDLFGIIFEGHPDLRRLLTDYGFIGYPFRKDFPVTGYMEMRYDEEQKRVIYQPVTIEPREITPRVIREENYSGRN